MFLTDKEMREADPPSTFDNTLLTTWASCPRKFYWFWRGLDYAFVPPYFVFGRVWQIVLDAWYSKQTSPEMSPSEIYSWGLEALEVGRAAWDEDGVEGAGVNTWENLELLFKYYIGTYPTEPFKVIGTEAGWEWPLVGTPYFLGGSLDGYLEWPGLGLLVLENKTSGVYLSDNYIDGWSFSSQISQYIWYLTQLHAEEVFGCYMNMACKRIPKKKEPEDLFARDLQKRSPFQLEEFVDEVILQIKDIEREWDRWIWSKARNQIECVGGIGKSPCLFRPLCKAQAKPGELEDPTSFEGITWREGPWAPWKRSGKD